MRLRSSWLAIISVAVGSLPASPLLAQMCLGLPADRGAITLGLEGTDGASGVSADLAARSGRLTLGLTYASLNKFAQDDDVMNTGVHVAWQWIDGAVGLCAVAGSEWTSYEAGASSLEWTESEVRHREYFVTGDFNRIRTPIGFSIGREFRAEHRIGITPFATLAVVHDHERMHWADGSLESRNSFGPAGTLGLAIQLDPVLLRFQLGNVWTEQRALSGHNDHLSLTAHVGWTF